MNVCVPAGVSAAAAAGNATAAAAAAGEGAGKREYLISFVYKRFTIIVWNTLGVFWSLVYFE